MTLLASCGPLTPVLITTLWPQWSSELLWASRPCLAGPYSLLGLIWNIASSERSSQLLESGPETPSLQLYYSVSVMHVLFQYCNPKFYIDLIVSLFTISFLDMMEHHEGINRVSFIHHILTTAKDYTGTWMLGNR